MTCTCRLHYPGDYHREREWEQNPECREHPDTDYLIDELQRVRDELAQAYARAASSTTDGET